MTIKFDHFLGKFPEIELPVTLSEDTHLDFSKENDPLPGQMIAEFIGKYEAAVPDEDLTEYIACLRLPTEKREYKAIVYWRASLLSYDYVLATYNPKTGVMIDKKAIAGTKIVGDNIKRIVAIINEDFTIHVVEGMESETGAFDPDASKARRFELFDSGRIEQDY